MSLRRFPVIAAVSVALLAPLGLTPLLASPGASAETTIGVPLPTTLPVPTRSAAPLPSSAPVPKVVPLPVVPALPVVPGAPVLPALPLVPGAPQKGAAPPPGAVPLAGFGYLPFGRYVDDGLGSSVGNAGGVPQGSFALPSPYSYEKPGYDTNTVETAADAAHQAAFRKAAADRRNAANGIGVIPVLLLLLLAGGVVAAVIVVRRKRSTPPAAS